MSKFTEFPPFEKAMPVYRVINSYRDQIKRTDTHDLKNASCIAKVMSLSTEDRPSELFMVVDQDNTTWAVFIDGVEFKRS